ncbi:MAG: sulfotransferase, partial [Cyanobacteriota bacterium]|nr:sulfotransferase [Cyanobacteriota bacterium]
KNPAKLFKKTLNFLKLPEWLPQDFKVHNSNQYSALKPETRQQLINYFKPYNQQLYDHLGVNFDWDH